MLRALGDKGVRVLVDRRQLARRDGRARRPARRGARLRRRPSPRAEGGARPCVPRRLSPRARRRRRAGARDGLRLLARPERRAAPDRRGRGRRRPRARLALRHRRRRAQLGLRAPVRLRRRLAGTRASCSASAVRDLTGGFKCYRRRVLETIDLDAIDARATPSRSRRPTARCAPASGSSRCRSPSPTARWEARRCRRRSSPRRSGRFPRSGSRRSRGCF